MASNHINIPGGTRYALIVRSVIDQTRIVQNQLSQTLSLANSYLGDTPDLTALPTYADLAIALGLTGATANSDAKKFYNMLVNAQERMTGNAIQKFLDNLG